MTTSVPSVPLRKPGLKGWADAQREKAGAWTVAKRDQGLGWAREQEQSPSAIRRKAGATLIENTALVMTGRSLSRVHRVEDRLVTNEAGQPEVRKVEVLRKVPSTIMGVLGSVIAIGATIPVVGYAFAAAGGVFWAGVAAGAKFAKRDDIATPATRLSLLTSMALLPVAGNFFVALILVSEIYALVPRKPAVALPAS